MADLRISPNFRRSDFRNQLTIDDMITIFRDRTLGWQIEIALQCWSKVQHSGFAVLHILVSYFEMIAQFERGEISAPNTSRKFFKYGFLSVFDDFQKHTTFDRDKLENTISGKDVLDDLYELVRCGLYHSGITKASVLLTEDASDAVAWEESSSRITICPPKLAQRIYDHFNQYVTRLHASNDSDEVRRRFTRRFEAERAKLDMNLDKPPKDMAVVGLQFTHTALGSASQA